MYFTLEFSSPPKGSRNESIATWRTNVPSVPIQPSEWGVLKAWPEWSQKDPPYIVTKEMARGHLSGQPGQFLMNTALRGSADGFLKRLRTKQLEPILYFSVIRGHSGKSPK